MVALHGLGSTAREIAIPLLALRDRYRLVVPDRPGYGPGAARQSRPMPAEAQAIWLHHHLIGEGVHRPIIVAHSIAAVVALCHARRYPQDVAGLVLVAPFCRPARRPWMQVLRLALLPPVATLFRRIILPLLVDRIGKLRLAASFAPDSVPDYLAALPPGTFMPPHALATMATELLGLNAAMAESQATLRRLAVPTIIIAGGADRLAAPARHAAWLAGLLPDARLIVVPGVGHMLHHVVPNVVIQAIDAINDRRSDAPPSGH